MKARHALTQPWPAQGAPSGRPTHRKQIEGQIRSSSSHLDREGLQESRYAHAHVHTDTRLAPSVHLCKAAPPGPPSCVTSGCSWPRACWGPRYAGTPPDLSLPPLEGEAECPLPQMETCTGIMSRMWAASPGKPQGQGSGRRLCFSSSSRELREPPRLSPHRFLPGHGSVHTENHQTSHLLPPSTTLKATAAHNLPEHSRSPHLEDKLSLEPRRGWRAWEAQCQGGGRAPAGFQEAARGGWGGAVTQPV